MEANQKPPVLQFPLWERAEKINESIQAERSRYGCNYEEMPRGYGDSDRIFVPIPRPWSVGCQTCDLI